MPPGKENNVMAEYWQEKRLTTKHVAFAWALVVVVLAGMVVVEALT